MIVNNVIESQQKFLKFLDSEEKAHREQSLIVKERSLEKLVDRGTYETNYLPLKPTSQEFREWLTGFWEGDGHSESRYRRIGFTQANYEILVKIQETLEGGELHERRSGYRFFSLEFYGSQALEIVDMFRPYLVSPLRLKQLNYLLSYWNEPLITNSKPTKLWFVGFWDAEGWSHSSSYTSIGVGQKELLPLTEIQYLFNCGKISTRKDGISIWNLSSMPKYRKSFNLISNLLITNSLNESKRQCLIVDLEFPGKLSRSRQMQDEPFL